MGLRIEAAIVEAYNAGKIGAKQVEVDVMKRWGTGLEEGTLMSATNDASATDTRPVARAEYNALLAAHNTLVDLANETCREAELLETRVHKLETPEAARKGRERR